MVTRPRTQPDYRFDFCGGHLAVDFTNTIGNRGDAASREEHFGSVGDVLAWADAAGILDRRQLAALRELLARDPDKARGDLARVRDLREVLYRVFSARARGRVPPPADLKALNEYVRDVYGRAALVPSSRRLRLETPAVEGIDVLLVPIVRAAVELLTSAAQDRLGVCADDSCAWLFLDATRSGTRRWCDMKSCGNRSKVRRFRKSS
jgi:predicted RNA-binding Zn ribbon-like protein